MIKKGDTVRFLNAVGGGIVVRVDEFKNMVYVEDTDGFEIPVLARECVLMGAINKETNFPTKEIAPKATNQTVQVQAVEHKISPVIETAEGETLKALLAFFPKDIKQLQTTATVCYFVNDSNYFLYYNIINGENNTFKSVAHGTIEPNTQEFIVDICKEELSAWEKIRVQIVPFKEGKYYSPQSVVDVDIKINVVKFYKLHSFTMNEYFDDPALLIDIASEKEKFQLSDISPEEIKKAMFQKEEPSKPKVSKPMIAADILEIDLHINELLDSTAGLSNTEMMMCQLSKFHEVLEEYKNNKGKKIVFIHGKGEGVLRKEIEKQLKTRYKSYYFQDASFREYGFGATLVTIK
jgi:Domain of unknown function (DUF2027)/Smr domain